MDELVHEMSSLNCSSKFYYINNSYSGMISNQIMKVPFSYYEVIALFGIPNCLKSGKYEWILESSDNSNEIFKIYNKKSCKNIKNVKEWYINGNTHNDNAINKFLNHISEALKCYRTNYKCIENNVFSNENTVIDKELKEISENFKNMLQ